MVSNMGFKKNIILMSLLTGALVSSSFNMGQSTKSYVSLLYNASPQVIYQNEDVLIDTNMAIPTYNSMVPQGLTYVDGFFLISSYDYNKEKNSTISVVDLNGQVVNVCELGNKAHLGGISYDRKNSFLWVTGLNGTINIYNVNDILNSTSAVPIYSDLMVGSNLTNFKNPFANSASFLTIFNDKLYVGNFSLNNHGLLKEYNISLDFRTKILKLDFIREIAIPNKVQGVDFYEKDDNAYIIFSRSYGQNVPSILQMFKYNHSIDDYRDSNLSSVCLEYPPMLEQSIVLNDDLYSVFESSAMPYTNNRTDTKNIIELNLDLFIKKLQKK